MTKILYGHDIYDQSKETSSLYKNLRTPLRQIEQLFTQHGNQFISFEELKQQAKRDTFLLTFDDGYRGILTHLLPLLERYEVPCLLFITTDFVKGRSMPYELLLLHLIEQKALLHLPILFNGQKLECRDSEQALTIYQKIRLRLKLKSTQRQQSYLKQLYKLNNVPLPKKSPLPFLNWKEIKELSEHPLVTIGAHSKKHSFLPTQNLFITYKEILHSKQVLEHKLGHEIDMFAYPYGGHNFKTRTLVKLGGFSYAFTTEQKEFSNFAEISPLAIPRCDINQITI